MTKQPEEELMGIGILDKQFEKHAHSWGALTGGKIRHITSASVIVYFAIASDNVCIEIPERQEIKMQIQILVL